MDNLKIILLTVLTTVLITLLISVIFTIDSNKTNILIFSIILVVLILNNTMNNSSNQKNINKLNINSNKTNIKYVNVPITEKSSNWTYDKIIPIDKYNKCDCTNDGSCIIPPDKINIFPSFNKKKQVKYVKLKKNEDIPIQNIINNTTRCKLCKTYISLLNNPITENFTTYNPYRDSNRYENPESLEFEKKQKKIINKLVENIKNNRSNTNINLQDMKELKDDICIHCKTGICLNDACYSI